VAGAMKNVMWKGQLFGTIDLDTIFNKQHLYGLGPVEYLTGELLKLGVMKRTLLVRGIFLKTL
jgi:acetolactate decarboxylase